MLHEVESEGIKGQVIGSRGLSDKVKRLLFEWFGFVEFWVWISDVVNV